MGTYRRQYLFLSHHQLGYSHVIVDLDLWEKRNLVTRQSKRNVATAVSRTALDTPPILDLGHDHIDTFTKEMVHVLTLELARHTQVLARANIEPGDGLLGPVCRDSDICDCLQHHACDVQVSAVLDGTFDHAVHGNLFQPGHVTERDWFAK